MAPNSSTLAWKIPWAEEPGRLQSMGSQRVGHDWATSFSLFTFMQWRRKWQATPVFLAWRIPGTGEPGGLPSMGSHRVGQDWSDLVAAAAAVMSDVEHLFMCLLAICMSSLQKYLFRSLANFLIESFIFLKLRFRSCLYILEINALSVFHLLLFSPILKTVFSPCL